MKPPMTMDAVTIVGYVRGLLKPEFFINEHNSPFVTFKDGDKVKTLPMKSREWESTLRLFIRKQQWKVSEYTRKEILAELVSLAEQNKKRVWIRTGVFQDKIIIDLGSDTYKCVEISASGFKILDISPLPFYRPAKQVPLPLPKKIEQRSFVREIKRWLPKEENQWLLLLAFLLKSLHCNNGAYVILIVEGPAGSGKTTLCRRIKRLLDPAMPWSHSPPNNNDDVISASANSYLLVFDNTSGINHRIADVFCRISTGAGLAKRKLYADHDEASYNLHQPCIINGIDEPSTRADFLDRAMTIPLRSLPDSERISETELDRTFEERLPYILGGLYQLLADCMKTLPSIQNSNLPRMSDFARMGLALEEVLELKRGTFLRAYSSNRDKQAEESFDNDDLCAAINRALTIDSHKWSNDSGKTILLGTASDLRKRFAVSYKLTTKNLKGFTSWLKRIEPLLETRGITVDRESYRTSSARSLGVYFNDAPTTTVDDDDSHDIDL